MFDPMFQFKYHYFYHLSELCYSVFIIFAIKKDQGVMYGNKEIINQ
jgi:hypothetical protein